MDYLPRILFVSHLKARCGVYEFGRAISESLAASSKYRFERVECADVAGFHAAVKDRRPAAIIYNHHPSTLPWLDRSVVRRHRGPHLGILHEVTQEVADNADSRIFDFHIAADPTLLLRNPIVFKTGRLVPSYTNSFVAPSIPTIGSFGFGTFGKGFETLVRTVQDQFDRAAIRLRIPYASFADADGEAARAIADRCRDLLSKPGIDLEVGHDFMTNRELLDFLAQNSLNAFLYEQQKGRGISSVIDHALAVGRPIAVTRSSMFRHVRDANPPIAIEDATLPEILSQGFGPLARYRKEWSAENLLWDYERIVGLALAGREQLTDSPLTSLGRTLAHTRIAEGATAAVATVARKVATATSPVLRQTRQRVVSSRIGGVMLTALHTRPAVTKAFRSIRAKVGRVSPRPNTTSNDWVPQGIATSSLDARISPAVPYTPLPAPLRLNRILDLSACELYAPALEYMHQHLPHMMARKIPRANVQQAFVLDTVLRLIAGRTRPSLMCVGSFEDTAAAAVTLSGYVVDEVDPVINYDLDTYVTKPSCRLASYDAIFATSVIEHVANDGRFLQHIEDLLTPGGFGILTCDFNDQYSDGDPLPVEDHRFYSTRDFHQRVLPLLSRSELVDSPDWRCEVPDFVYGGCHYTFASLVFQRTR
jgi:hypothetical protein